MPSPMIYQDLTTAALLGHAAQYRFPQSVAGLLCQPPHNRDSLAGDL